MRMLHFCTDLISDIDRLKIYIQYLILNQIKNIESKERLVRYYIVLILSQI